MNSYRQWSLILTLTLLGSRAALGSGYSLIPVAKLGDTAAAVQISGDADGEFEVGTLNDNAQLTFVTRNSAGGEILGLYSEGAWMPLLAGGSSSPTGPWPADVILLSPVSMNQAGNIAFTVSSDALDSPGAETFLWDASTQQSSHLAKNGQVVTFAATWDRGGDWVTAINNSGDVAYVAGTQDPKSQGRGGIFYRPAGGQSVTVSLPDDPIEDGRTMIDASDPYLNDHGIVTFTARRSGDPQDASSAYRWEAGARAPIALVGADLPGGHKVANVLRAWANNKNSNILLALNADFAGDSDQVEAPISLYLWADGVFTPVAVPGQTMPDGSKLLSVQDFGVSRKSVSGWTSICAASATCPELFSAIPDERPAPSPTLVIVPMLLTVPLLRISESLPSGFMR
jgi:hypothetical protein